MTQNRPTGKFQDRPITNKTLWTLLDPFWTTVDPFRPLWTPFGPLILITRKNFRPTHVGKKHTSDMHGAARILTIFSNQSLQIPGTFPGNRKFRESEKISIDFKNKLLILKKKSGFQEEKTLFNKYSGRFPGKQIYFSGNITTLVEVVPINHQLFYRGSLQIRNKLCKASLIWRTVNSDCLNHFIIRFINKKIFALVLH